MLGIHFQFDRGSYRLRLSLIGNDAENRAASEYLFNGHRNRLGRNFLQALEPTFSNLLLATRVIKVNDNVRLICIEVRRRIVKCEVPVFTNTYQGDINRIVLNKISQSLTFRFWVFFAMSVLPFNEFTWSLVR